MSYKTEMVYLENGSIDMVEKDYQVSIAWQEYDYFAGDGWERDYWRKAFRCEAWPVDVVRYFRNDPIADYEEIVLRGED